MQEKIILAVNLDIIIAKGANIEVLILLYCTAFWNYIKHSSCMRVLCLVLKLLMHQVKVLSSTDIQCMKTMHHSKHETVTF